MPDGSEKGAFTADIPASAIADAVAAVEKGRARSHEPAGPGAEVTIEAESPAAAAGAEAAANEVDALRAELEMSQEGSRKLYELFQNAAASAAAPSVRAVGGLWAT